VSAAAFPPREPAPVPRRAYALSAGLGLLLLASAVLDLRPTWAIAAGVAVAGAVASYRWFTQWRVMISAIGLCILLVPIARYGLPIELPFQLEPYRAIVVVVAIAWLLTLLAEPDGFRVPHTGLGAPLTAIVLVLTVSVVVNLHTIHERGVMTDVIFKASFFVSFFLVMLMIGSVLRTRAEMDFVIKALVGGAAVVSFFTLVENKTGYNVFNHVHQIMPLFRFQPGGVPDYLEARGTGFRVYGSAQHPLALGAALVTLLPLGIYLGFRTRRWFWWGAAGLICIASFATVSRTAVMMLFVEGVVLVALKPRELKRYWWVVPPLLVAVNIAVPSTLGTLKSSFFPEGGLIAQQSTTPGGDASNRVADLGPSLEEAKKTPFVGQGWGTRLPEHLDPTKSNRYLDNQWLGILLEAGWFGVLIWLWFFLRNVRLLAGAAVRDDSPHGWLLAGLAAAVFAFAVGMFTYDAFGFTQATLLMFAVVGIGIAARNLPPDDPGPLRAA
jgi:polysaccharide biosynthesis protein PslJ